ncbi:MAG TPA: fumarylacetoacetate hydrolase family protein [Ktedonobacterales bacterium]|nr:fumarylacetoacetate hydrolase family protein [Ktedonobacterales bacterium]
MQTPMIPLPHRALCRVFVPGVGPRLGGVYGDGVVDLTGADPERCATLSDLLAIPNGIEQVLTTSAALPPTWSFAALDQAPDATTPHLLAPIDEQEVWAAGVTYTRSREARIHESQNAADVYARVYDAERPELFFKSLAARVVGSHAAVAVRPDASWSVPEPELTLLLDASFHIVGCTVGNDMSSRDIEGQNPLYLPQAKVYERACALGPVIVPFTDLDTADLAIHCAIHRDGQVIFTGETSTAALHRRFDELVAYLGRCLSFPHGVYLMTGTGIVPPDMVSLHPGDTVTISIAGIGTLINTVSEAVGQAGRDNLPT